MLEEQDDTILARWLSGELSPEEQDAFEKSESFTDYTMIINGANRFVKPSFDKEVLRAKILSEIDTPKKTKVFRLKPWYYAAAASILVFLSLGLFFKEINYTSQVGEQRTVTLPDGSLVHLNAGSHLKRNRFFWSSNKKVILVQGEGFFEVEKGDGFEVQTKLGSVQVLGTKFNIKNRPDYFQVSCYDGKVQFVAAETNTKTILTKGQEIIQIEGAVKQDNFTDGKPSWMTGESLFRNTPLQIVLKELEIQYGISIKTEAIKTDEKYTGGFTHRNLETALKAVLAPMSIDYVLSEDKKTVSLTAIE